MGNENRKTEIREKILCFCKGDNDAFAYLFNLWQRELYFYAYRFLKNDKGAEDILHDAFEKIIKTDVAYRMHKFKGEESEFKGFLKLMIKNKALDILKTEKNRGRILEELRYSAPKTNENESNIKEQVAFVKFLLSPLESREKQIIGMHIEGYSTEEIGNSFFLSKKTVSNVISISKKKLKDFWLNKKVHSGK